MINENNLISVIVPVFNVEDYIERCIKSILNQTYNNLEIILVDDGSTDKSGEICDLYKEKDNRIKVIHNKNSGPSVARNCGLSIAKGKYIGFVDSDDFIALDMYETLYHYMKEDADVVCCATLSITNHNKEVRYKSKGVVSYTKLEGIKELLKTEHICFSACDKLFRRNLLENIRFPRGRQSEDLPFIYQVFKKSNKIVNIGKVKYFYFYRPDSRSNADFDIRRLDYIYFSQYIYHDIQRSYPQLSKVAERRYILDLYWIIVQIKNLSKKEKYIKERKMLERTLRHMVLLAVTNPYMSKQEKIMCIKIVFT